MSSYLLIALPEQPIILNDIHLIDVVDREFIGGSALLELEAESTKHLACVLSTDFFAVQTALGPVRSVTPTPPRDSVQLLFLKYVLLV